MAKTPDIYPERESKTLEFKSKLPSLQTLIKTCVAFANTAGGSIIIGIEDQSRKIIGASDKDRDRLYEDFPNSLYDSTSPGLFIHIYEKNLNDCVVMIIEVPFSAKRPVYIKQEGMPKGVYIRVGSSNRRAQPEHIQDLIREGKHDYYDEEATKATLDDLATSLLKTCYGSSYTNKKLLAECVITQSMHQQSYHATVAGTLMFCEQPEQFIPEANVLCTQFAGTDGRDIIQTREINGAIPQLSHETLQLMTHWLRKDYQLKGAKLSGKTIIPPDALREAIVNALLHRKYTVPGSVKCALYDDRLEIFSPGAFPGLVDIKNLGDGTTYLRNPHLARLARRFHLVEKLGTGIKLIFDACKKAGIKKPEYRETGDFVKLIFWFSPDTANLTTDEEAILKLLSIRSEISTGDVIELLNVSRNTATRKLNQLIQSNKVQRHGKGPAVRYTRL
ncbi:MAG: ATP-binding protein [Coxiellaceae bacterium]|nr:ATP-binding protein [Coxiellaceae bacterium]